MSEAKLAYFVDTDGKVVSSPAEEAAVNLATGYIPASPKQIEDFKKEEAFQAKYSTPGQQIATFGEGAAQALTLGLSTPVERGLGVSAESIKAREEINPKAHLAGSVVGVAAPLVLSGGTSALAEGASLTAPSLIARAGEGIAELLPEAAHASSALGRLGLTIAKGAATAGTEGALYGVGHVVHEAGLGDPHLTAQSALEEIGLSGLLGAGVGGAGGLMTGLTHELTGGQLGEKLADWAHRFEGERALSSAAGGRGVQSLIKKDAQRIGFDNLNQLAREGMDLGLVDVLSTPTKTLARSEELMDAAGQDMGRILEGADAMADVAQPSAARVMSRARNEVLKPLEENPLNAGEAKRIGELFEAFDEKLGSANPENKVALSELQDIRHDVSKKIYGLRGDMTVSSEYKQALHDFRDVLSEELNRALDSTPGLDSAAWKAANRKYQVGATFSKYAEKGITSELGHNLIPLTPTLAGLAGAVSGGPLGGLALGVAGFLAKKYGSGALATGARYLRNAIEKDAAKSLINKTADLISAERSEGARGASNIAEAWNRALAKAEPLGAPVKDVTREQLKERVASESSAEPERLGALSQLEKAQKTVAKRVDALADAVVKGRRVARGELEEGIAESVAHTGEDYEKRLERVHQLAGNPELLQQHLTGQVADVHEHAPNTAQAIQLTTAAAVSYLHHKFPLPARTAPLAPKLKPSGADIHRLNQTLHVLEKPSRLLKHAANGTLTPTHVEAVAAVYPERLRQIQSAVIEKLAENDNRAPYRQRLMLSMLFGQPMDGTTSPQSIQAAQLAYSLPSAKSPENQAGGGRSTQTGLGKLDVASHSRLPGQSAEIRRRDV